MSNVKIVNPVAGESDAQRVSRCAHNLLKAILAAGYDIRATNAISGFDIDIYKSDNSLRVHSCICDWSINCGSPRMKIEFGDVIYHPSYSDAELTEDAKE